MPHIHSFPPIENEKAKVLILGSMPSVASLQKQQYYGHAQNAFWKIMGELFKFEMGLDYQARCATLTSHKIAVWDVLKCCTREGSLDSAIDDSSIEVNDFTLFFQKHPKLERVYFNGAKAEQVFNKYCRSVMNEHPHLHYARLPSTSPAHAAMSFENKLAAWNVVLDYSESKS